MCSVRWKWAWVGACAESFRWSPSSSALCSQLQEARLCTRAVLMLSRMTVRRLVVAVAAAAIAARVVMVAVTGIRLLSV